MRVVPLGGITRVRLRQVAVLGIVPTTGSRLRVVRVSDIVVSGDVKLPRRAGEDIDERTSLAQTFGGIRVVIAASLLGERAPPGRKIRR